MDIFNVHMIRNLRCLEEKSRVWIISTLDLLSSLFELFMQEKFVIIESTLVRNLFFAYSQFILARHGHLGKGNGRVCPFCVVLRNKKTISLTYRCLHGLSRT